MVAKKVKPPQLGTGVAVKGRPSLRNVSRYSCKLLCVLRGVKLFVLWHEELRTTAREGSPNARLRGVHDLNQWNLKARVLMLLAIPANQLCNHYCI